MRPNDLPANISLINLPKSRIEKLQPVSMLDIFDGATNNFHEQGLFSTTIFGRVGSDIRDEQFSYIDIKTKVLHPFIFHTLVGLKGLYGGIMAERAWAKWDVEEKDFVQSDEIHGSTGYAFFMEHWKDIVFKETGSDIRSLKIKAIEKYKNIAEYNKILVIPAGLRDLIIDETGRMKQDEVNDIYRSIIAISNAIGRDVDLNSPILDVSRWSLQNAFNRLFDYLSDVLSGKKGFLQGKWAHRNVFNGTRNVITAMDTSVEYLGAPNSPKTNDSVVGIYQMAKAALPVTRFELSNGWISQVFGVAGNMSNLVNPKTLKREQVRLAAEDIDRWTKTDGLDKVIASLSEAELRSRPVMVNGYYIGLIYTGADMSYRIFGDIDELPDGFSREDVHPLTLCELVYLSCWKRWHTLGALVTRYPVTGDGSIYPSHPYVKTTIRGEMRWELDENWERMGDDHVALEFPISGMNVYVESLIPHPSRVAGLGADYDGDMSSFNVVYSDNAVDEVNQYLNSARAYLNADGSLKASPITDTIEYVLYNMTGD